MCRHLVARLPAVSSLNITSATLWSNRVDSHLVKLDEGVAQRVSRLPVSDDLTAAHNMGNNTMTALRDDNNKESVWADSATF